MYHYYAPPHAHHFSRSCTYVLTTATCIIFVHQKHIGRACTPTRVQTVRTVSLCCDSETVPDATLHTHRAGLLLRVSRYVLNNNKKIKDSNVVNLTAYVPFRATPTENLFVKSTNERTNDDDDHSRSNQPHFEGTVTISMTTSDGWVFGPCPFPFCLVVGMHTTCQCITRAEVQPFRRLT